MPSDGDTAEDRRCRRCGVPHADHPESNKSGGVGGLLAWADDLCPICLDRRRELRHRAAVRYVAALLDPSNDYVSAAGPEQTTLPEVIGADV